MPYEGRENFMDLTYYDPMPTEAVANDDLDLQVVWLEHMKERELALDNAYLAQAWIDHIDAHPDEYGIALWNIKKGLTPPITGIHNNPFTHGMGSMIRSEIWASLFPGKPLTAAWFAFQDASVDHWNEGVYAEMYLSATQSHLYDSGNIRESLTFGLSLLPAASLIRKAVESVLKCYDDGVDYPGARDWAMKRFGSINFTDCIMNMCFIVIGLLYGENDFEKSLLYAVNCGRDADCTGATIAAFMGILLGCDAIPDKWKEPIGEKIVVGDYITGIDKPGDLDTFVNDINALRARFEDRELPAVETPFMLPEIEDFSDENSWLVNGEKILFDGFKLDAAKYDKHVAERIVFETDVRFSETMDIQIMVCSQGLFRLRFNDRFLGLKGDQSVPVPAIHRTKGGRVFNASVEKGETYSVSIELFPTLPIPDLFVAFADMENRHLLVEYTL